MLTLAGKPLAVPILQGGMGVGVSLGGLAGAVAACGGMGCISTADTGYREPDFAKDPVGANRRALAAEIKKAKEIANGAGLVAINAMVATQNYADAVKTAVEAGVDAIVSGAGLPLELPGLVEKADVALAPIVSSGRAAKLILRRWAKSFGRTADFVVIEGCKAGGHLGFSEEELLAGKCQTLDEILPEVLAEVKPYEEQFGHAIPVFVAGGVYTGEDIAHYARLGAAGAQLATRFIPTYECDASQTYKDVLLAAQPEDVRIIHSPVGMPGRALNTPLVQKLAEGLRAVNVPVLLTPAAANLDDTYRQIEVLGQATGHGNQARALVDRMRGDIDKIVRDTPKPPHPMSYYHEISPDHYTATAQSFVGSIYGLFGLTNIADPAGGQFPRLSDEQILHANPNLIFLADTQCCQVTPEAVAQRPGWGTLDAVRAGHVVPLDDDVVVLPGHGPTTTIGRERAGNPFLQGLPATDALS